MLTYSPANTRPASPNLTCLNCDESLVGRFCHSCGQSASQERRLGLEELITSFFIRKVSLESGVIKTFIDLTIRPGTAMRAYFNGRRRTYVDPVGYLLIGGAFSQFLLPLYLDAMAADLTTTSAGQESVEAALAEVMLFLERHPLAQALLLGTFLAPSMRWMFAGQIKTAEALAYAFFMAGHLCLWQGIFVLLATSAGRNPYELSSDALNGIWLVFIGASVVGLFGARFSTFVKTGIVMAMTITGVAGTVLLATMAVMAAAGTTTG